MEWHFIFESFFSKRRDTLLTLLGSDFAPVTRAYPLTASASLPQTLASPVCSGSLLPPRGRPPHWCSPPPPLRRAVVALPGAQLEVRWWWRRRGGGTATPSEAEGPPRPQAAPRPPLRPGARVRPSRPDGASPGDERPHTHADRHGSLVRHPRGRWARTACDREAARSFLAHPHPGEQRRDLTATTVWTSPKAACYWPAQGRSRGGAYHRQQLTGEGGGGGESVVRDRWSKSPGAFCSTPPVCRESCDGAGRAEAPCEGWQRPGAGARPLEGLWRCARPVT